MHDLRASMMNIAKQGHVFSQKSTVTRATNDVQNLHGVQRPAQAFLKTSSDPGHYGTPFILS
jgi:hypothetical protein